MSERPTNEKASDTPRVDALEIETRLMAGPTMMLERERVVWELARQLERELDDRATHHYGRDWSTCDECGVAYLHQHPEADMSVVAAQAECERNTVIEECARVCDDTAKLQSEMAMDPDTEESMVRYRKARAWDASVCAATIRALKRSPYRELTERDIQMLKAWRPK